MGLDLISEIESARERYAFWSAQSPRNPDRASLKRAAIAAGTVSRSRCSIFLIGDRCGFFHAIENGSGSSSLLSPMDLVIGGGKGRGRDGDRKPKGTLLEGVAPVRVEKLRGVRAGVMWVDKGRKVGVSKMVGPGNGTRGRQGFSAVNAVQDPEVTIRRQTAHHSVGVLEGSSSPGMMRKSLM
ncbi:hypothetical protein ACLOJK_032656 [Asimina triloba]